VISTHLGLALGERRYQVDRLLECLDARAASFLAVLGDFNDWLPGRSVLHRLEDRLGPSLRLPSFPVFRPLFALDRIWVHPGSAVVEQRVHKSPLALRASDHLPVVTTVVKPRS
jgi:endonuclease/exonuclease/phosphatase family metal-dependent hydrolase